MIKEVLVTLMLICTISASILSNVGMHIIVLFKVMFILVAVASASSSSSRNDKSSISGTLTFVHSGWSVATERFISVSLNLIDERLNNE